MKQTIAFLVGILFAFQAYTQNNTGIGTTTPNPNALLELQNNGNPLGLLLPRQDISTFSLGLADAGMMVFNPVDNKVYTWDGGNWVSSTSEWGVNGTSIYNLNSGNVGIGTNTPAYPLDVVGRINATTATIGTTTLTFGARVEVDERLNVISAANTSRVFIGESGSNYLDLSWNNAGNYGQIATNNGPLILTPLTSNVGIGTTNPLAELSIATASNLVLQLDGSAATGTWLSMNNSSAGGQWFHIISSGASNVEGAGKMLFHRGADAGTASGIIMTMVHSNSYVGIGTSNPLGRLHIEPTDWNISPLHLNSSSTSAGSTIRFTNPAVGNHTYDIIGSTGTGSSPGPGAFGIWDHTASTYRMVISPTGNVGINTFTPTSAKLVISGTAGQEGLDLASTDQYANLRVIRNSLSTIDKDMYIGFQSGAGSELHLYSNNLETMTITSNRVGVGTISPSYPLTLGATGSVFGVENTSSFVARNSGGTYETYLWPRWSDNIMYLNYGSGGFHIRNNNSTTTMFMTSDNRVGIGTTSPSTWGKIHIAAGDLAVDGTTAEGIKWVSGNTLLADVFRWGNSNNALYVTNNGVGNLTGVYLAVGATSWTSSSDVRLKENIKESSYGLQEILQLSPKEYNFKTTEEKNKRIGFLAQDVYNVIPEIVKKGDDGSFDGNGNVSAATESGFEPWGINYTDLIPVLVKAVQELNTENERLQERIRVLETDR